MDVTKSAVATKGKVTDFNSCTEKAESQRDVAWRQISRAKCASKPQAMQETRGKGQRERAYREWLLRS
jgi:hypothetical protein